MEFNTLFQKIIIKYDIRTNTHKDTQRENEANQWKKRRTLTIYKINHSLAHCIAVPCFNVNACAFFAKSLTNGQRAHFTLYADHTFFRPFRIIQKQKKKNSYCSDPEYYN